MKTIEQLPDSPAGGKVFYDPNNDTCTLEYCDYKLIYSNRIKGQTDKLPYCFNDCKRINNAN